jgi:DNA primase
MGSFHDDLLKKVATYCSQFYRTRLEQDPARQDALLRYGFSEDIIQSFDIGYAPSEWTDLTDRLMNDERDYIVDCARTLGLVIKGDRGLRDRFNDRYVFPIRNQEQQVVGFSSVLARSVNPEFTSRPLDVVRLNSSHSPIFDKRAYLFGGDKARDAVEEKGLLLVADDPLDTLFFHSKGRPYVVSELVQGAIGAAPADSLTAYLRDESDQIFRIESEPETR